MADGRWKLEDGRWKMAEGLTTKNTKSAKNQSIYDLRYTIYDFKKHKEPFSFTIYELRITIPRRALFPSFPSVKDFVTFAAFRGHQVK